MASSEDLNTSIPARQDELLAAGEMPDQTAELCALDGCELPLPARGLDENGRAKGGRRARYCSKAHTDAASRQRRARDIASIDDPLALARAAGETFLPSARALAGQLTELISRFDQAENGALARVHAAEHEAAQALTEAAEATAAADTAEQARRLALNQARHDQQAGAEAMRLAETARLEADQIRTTAWEQVATHERARGQAEAAHAAAQQVAEELITENRALTARLEQARSGTAELTAQLAGRQTDLERARGETRALAVRAEALEQQNAQATDRFRQQVTELESQTAGLHAELAKLTATAAITAQPGSRIARGRRPQVAGIRRRIPRNEGFEDQ